MFTELSKAISQVCTIVSAAPGADCMLYAGIGAEVLNSLGYSAIAVAGSAAWRIGPGDGDCIAHAMELLPQISTVEVRPNSPLVGLFHCWIESEGTIIDFTTGSLVMKAKSLDKIDGGYTQVLWSPDYLLTSEKKLTSLVEVCQGVEIGSHSYVRHKELESIVFKDANFELLAVAVLQRLL